MSCEDPHDKNDETGNQGGSLLFSLTWKMAV